MRGSSPSVEGSMSIAAELRADTLVLLDELPAELYEPHPQSSDQDTFIELANRQFPLRDDYDLLAWSVFYFGKQHIEATVDSAQLYRYRALTALDGPAASGIRSMVSYASWLPFVYAGQRLQYPNMPATAEAQLQELWYIARQSGGVIERLAHEHGAIDRKIERWDLKLQQADDFETKQALIRGNDFGYRLVLDGQGFLKIDFPALERKIVTRHEAYQRDKGHAPRAKGCSTVRGGAEEDMPFQAYWHTVIDMAAQDPRLFANDLAYSAEYLRLRKV